MELTGTKGAMREAEPSATHVTRRNEGWTSINHYNRHDTLEWSSFAIPGPNSYTFIHATRYDRTKNVPRRYFIIKILRVTTNWSDEPVSP